MTANRAIPNASIDGRAVLLEFLPGSPGGIPAIRFAGSSVGFNYNAATGEVDLPNGISWDGAVLDVTGDGGAVSIFADANEGQALVGAKSTGASTDAQVLLRAIVGGDAWTEYNCDALFFSAGFDKSSGKYTIGRQATLGGDFLITTNATETEILNALKLNNTLQADAAAVSSHSVNIDVGGTVYKFLVKT